MKTCIWKIFFTVLLLGGTLFSSYAANTKVEIRLKGYQKDELQVYNFDYGKYNYLVNKSFKLKQTNGVASFEQDLDKPILVNINNLFNVFLSPGDDLRIDADVTKPFGGLKISYEGKGKENNKYLYDVMKLYYQYFPIPLEVLNDQKLNTQEVASRFDKAVSIMKETVEKNKNGMHASLYNYLYTYVNLVMPNYLLLSVRNNTYDKEVDLLKKYKVDLTRINLYVEGYYEINYLPFMNIGFMKFLGLNANFKSEKEWKDKIDSFYTNLEGLTSEKEIRAGILFYLVQGLGGNLPNDEFSKIYPSILKYSQVYPGPMADGLNRWYNSKIKIAPGKVPPTIDLLDIDGNKFSFESYKGKVVYVDFWASWCGPCRKQTKSGAPVLHEKFKNQEVAFIYVSLDTDPKAWKKAIQEDKIKGLHVNDVEGKVAKDYNITAIPRYMLIGKDGKIISDNAPRPADPEIQQMITKALSE